MRGRQVLQIQRDTGKSLILSFGSRVKTLQKKYSAFQNAKISVLIASARASRRGRFAVVTERWRGLRWAAAASGDPHQTKRWQRTAKSCGPGAATLASSRWSDRSATVAKQAAHRGEHEISRQTIARGKPGCPGCTLSNPCAFSRTFRTRAAGAVGARLSLRPLFKRGPTRLQSSGENRAVRRRACV
jgi:hypothetical protein